MAGKRARVLLNLPLMAVVVAMAVFMTACVPQPPAVDIVCPEDGGTVSDTVLIQAHATSNIAVERVGYRIDSGDWVEMSLVSDDELDGVWEADWDTTLVDDGFHTITVRARDSVGLTDTDSVVVVVDNVEPAPGSAEVNLRAEVVGP